MLFTRKNRVFARVLGICATLSLSASAFPAPLLVAHAQDTSAQTGTLIVQKEVTGDIPDSWSFGFTGDQGGFDLTNDSPAKTFSAIATGTYTITEESPDAGEHWELIDATCDNADSPSEVTISAGKTVTCTFTNNFTVSNEDDTPQIPNEIPIEQDPVCLIGDNLLANGSFEDPTVSTSTNAQYQGGFWQNFSSISNWISSNSFELWKDIYGGASNGSQNAELDVDHPTTITQAVNTTPGATYELRFDFSPRPNTNAANNIVTASQNGHLLVTASGTGTGLQTNDWTTYTTQFVASSTNTTISLADLGTDDGNGSLVDNAVLCKVQEAVQTPTLAITDPANGSTTLPRTHTFKAQYVDDDDTPDQIDWAIRAGTCDPNASATRAGNVGGFNDPSTFVGTDFAATVDMSTWDAGEYCFVVNPREHDGGPDLRETQTFYLDNEQEGNLCTVTIQSDDTNTVVEKDDAGAKLLSPVHSAWTSAFDLAQWIWGDNPVQVPIYPQTQTFQKSFAWNGPITGATLKIASDNTYDASLNGNGVGDGTQLNNFSSLETYNLNTNLIQQGTNTLRVAVTNTAGANNAKGNPAGLLYELQVTGTDTHCNQVPDNDPWCSYAGEVIDHSPDEEAMQNGGDPVESARRNVSGVENGPAVGQNPTGKETTWSTNDFYSLGIGGFLTYKFTDKVALNQVGDDIGIYEITGGSPSDQTDEKVKVEVSEDGTHWVSLGIITGDATLDIASTSLDYVQYVRLTDQSSGKQGTTGDGYDVDAIVILNGSCGDIPESSQCLVDGYKYDQDHNPLSGWPIALLGAKQWDEGQYSSPWLIGADVTDSNGYYCIKPHEYDFPQTCSLQNTEKYPHEAPALKLPDNSHNESFVVPQLDTVNFIAEDLYGHSGYTPLWAKIGNDTATTSLNTDIPYLAYTRIDPSEENRVDFYNQAGETPAPQCDPQKNLVGNGDFEVPVVDNDYGWNIFTHTDHPEMKWNVDFTSFHHQAEAVPALELHSYYSGWAPFGGNQYAELDSDWQGPGESIGNESASTKISQSVSTVPGMTYHLSWAFSPRPGTGEADNMLGVYVGNQHRATSSGDGTSLDDTQWSTSTYTFVATSSTTNIAFKDEADADHSNSLGVFLDNVSLTCDPKDSGGDTGGDDDTHGGGDGDENGTSSDLFRISGFVWDDFNANKVWDGHRTEHQTENPLSNWVIFATNGSTTMSTHTGSDGTYHFDVPFGSGPWTITEDVPEAWNQTTPTSGHYIVNVPNTPSFALAPPSFMQNLFALIIPVAHAETVATSSGSYDFGNRKYSNTGGSRSLTGSSGGTHDTDTNSLDTLQPVPRVLGEQVSAVPTGAPDTGAGGTSPLVIPSPLLSGVLLRRNTNKNVDER